MRFSPLILDFYFVKKVQFELKPGFDDDFNRDLNEVKAPKIVVNVNSARNTEQENSWRFELSIDADEKSSEDNFPYTFSITLVGFFRVDEEFPAESADMLAQINGPSVLYSAARECLASVTGRSPYSPILLPSASFVPDAEPEEETKKKQKPPVKRVKRITPNNKTKNKKS